MLSIELKTEMMLLYCIYYILWIMITWLTFIASGNGFILMMQRIWMKNEMQLLYKTTNNNLYKMICKCVQKLPVISQNKCQLFECLFEQEQKYWTNTETWDWMRKAEAFFVSNLFIGWMIEDWQTWVWA